MAKNSMSFNFSLGATLASGFKSVMGSTRSQIAGLGKDVRTMERTSTGRLGAQFAASSKKLAGLTADMKSARAQLGSLKNQANAAGGANDLLARQIAQAEKRVTQLTGATKRATHSHRELTASITSEAGSVGKLMREYTTLSTRMDKAREKQRLLSANLAAQDANKARRADLRGGMLDTLALGATVALPAKFAIDFEDSMARVGALARADKEDLARLTATARQLGRDTVFSASQAAQGMQYLAMAGFDTNETIAAMPGLLGLAAAGQTDLGRTADIASNILSAFKINASDMGRVSDVLANTFTRSNTSLETLGDTMKYVGPVASAVNMSLEDTAAVVGFMGNVGIQGSQAGTALRAALLRLAAPAKMGREALGSLTGAAGPELEAMLEELQGGQQALKEMGVATKDADGNLRPMVDIMEDLNGKMAGMGSGEKLEIIKKIFGSEASAAMAELLDKAGTTVDKHGNRIVDAYGKPTTAMRQFMETIHQSGGTTERIARQMNDTTGGALRAMRSAFEEVAIVTGNIFSPGIRKAADGLKFGANIVSGTIEKYPRLARVTGLAASAFVGLAVASKGLAYGYTFLKGGILIARSALYRFSGLQVINAAVTKGLAGMYSLLRGGVLLFAGSQNAATAATRRMTIAQRMNAVVSLLASGAMKAVAVAGKIMNTVFKASVIGLVITGVALGAGYIMENWSSIGPWFAGVWNSVTGIFKGAWEFISNGFSTVFNWLSDKFEWFRKSISGLTKAYNFFFGDDDKAEQTVEAAKETAEKTPTLAGEASAAAPKLPEAPLLSAGNAALPAASASGTGRKEVGALTAMAGQDTAMPDIPLSNTDMKELERLTAVGGGAGVTNETNITLDMAFDVKGLDEGEFKKKVEGYKDEFEKIIKRVVSEMESNNRRVAYAQG